jgi:hypothetical protein
MNQAKGARGAPRRAETEPGERRRSPRVLVDLEVDYASEDNYLFAYVTASMSDINASGIFIRTTTPEPPGTHLNLRFMPRPEDLLDLEIDAELELALDDTDDDREVDEGPLEVEGEVIWWNPYRPGQPDNLHPGMGVRFFAIDDRQRARVVELVRRIAYLT